MALFTYLFAFFHFGSEIFIYRTAKIAPPVLSPVAVAGKSRSPVLCYRYLTLGCVVVIARVLTRSSRFQVRR